ncbi:MAG: polysaccharide biosynthesis/export family protein [Planctomycetes bacterium]|nr:polysaccharide biosynthesis/export family protein [Planctomycetota bacterium]
MLRWLVLAVLSATSGSALVVSSFAQPAPRPLPAVPPVPSPRPESTYREQLPAGMLSVDVHSRRGVQCGDVSCGEGVSWDSAGPIPWQAFAQGEYIGPHRPRHVEQYRLRVDDLLDLVYRQTREETSVPYKFNVGDRIGIDSLTEKDLRREQIVLSDGTITLHLIGRVRVTGFTADMLRKTLEKRYKKFYKRPSITVTPLTVNTKLQSILDTVDSRAGVGGLARRARVAPDGTIALPALGSVPAQGLTLDELKRELDQRYAEIVEGIEVTPILEARAPRFIYVLGEVATPGRFALEGPTTVMQALALAGSWNVGAHLKQVVVFRRDKNWQLQATMIDIRGALYGKQPCPADEIWLRDSDIVVVPKHPILVADEFIELVFTRGIYGVLPNDALFGFRRLSSL